MTQLIRWLLIGLILNILSGSEGQAATINAANCSAGAVQTAISTAVNGDTVIIPNGSCTWTTGISTSKQITISGQTKGSVLITHSAGAGALLNITTGSSFSTEVRNTNFLAGSGTGYYIFVDGSGKPPLIHDNYFRVPDFQLLSTIRFERNGGVIFKNIFESLTASGAGGSGGAGSGNVQLKPINLGTSWTTASTMGTADANGTANTYIEDNTFINIYLQAIDCDDNARTVIRHNTFNNSGFVCHGADTSIDGARHTEVYNNTFIFTPSGTVNGVPYPLNLNRWWYVRGGTGIFADNIIPDITSGAWGAKPELSLTIQNLRRNAGPYACWSTYPVPHQIGQSHNGTSAVTDPFYVWGNTGTGTQQPALEDYNPDECGAGRTTATFVQAGRDYVVGVAKPGYTKYTYPHPLTLSGPAPAPPSGLRAP